MTDIEKNENNLETNIREDLVETAVKFLENQNVQRSPLNQKQQFLRSKGLTEGEIQMACEKAGVFTKSPLLPSQNPERPHTIVSMGPQPTIQTYPRFSFFKDILNTVALISGISYAIYLFYKRFIERWLFGDGRKKSKTVEDMIKELNENVSKTVTDLQDNLAQIKTEVGKIQQNGESNTYKQIKELKSEIKSVKSLLLSRKQFPSVNPVVPPSIPAWQLTSSHQSVEGEGEGDGDCMKQDDLLECGSGSGSSETEIVTKNSDSSLEIIS